MNLANKFFAALAAMLLSAACAQDITTQTSVSAIPPTPHPEQTGYDRPDAGRPPHDSGVPDSGYTHVGTQSWEFECEGWMMDQGICDGSTWIPETPPACVSQLYVCENYIANCFQIVCYCDSCTFQDEHCTQWALPCHENLPPGPTCETCHLNIASHDYTTSRNYLGSAIDDCLECHVMPPKEALPIFQWVEDSGLDFRRDIIHGD